MPQDENVSRRQRFLPTGGSENQLVIKSSTSEYDYAFIDGVIVEEDLLFGGISSLEQRLLRLANIENNFETSQSLVGGEIINSVVVSDKQFHGKKVILVGTNNSGIWYSEDDGRTFFPANSYVAESWHLRVASVVFDEVQPGVAIALLGSAYPNFNWGIARSVDFGKTWTLQVATQMADVKVGRTADGSVIAQGYWALDESAGAPLHTLNNKSTHPRLTGQKIANVYDGANRTVAASNLGLIDLTSMGYIDVFGFYGNDISSVTAKTKLPAWYVGISNTTVGDFDVPFGDGSYNGVGFGMANAVNVEAVNNKFGDIHAVKALVHNNRHYVFVAAGYDGVYYFKVPYGTITNLSVNTATIAHDAGDVFAGTAQAILIEKPDGTIITTTYNATVPTGAALDDYTVTQTQITLADTINIAAGDTVYSYNPAAVTYDRNWRKLIGPGGIGEVDKDLVGKIHVNGELVTDPSFRFSAADSSIEIIIDDVSSGPNALSKWNTSRNDSDKICVQFGSEIILADVVDLGTWVTPGDPVRIRLDNITAISSTENYQHGTTAAVRPWLTDHFDSLGRWISIDAKTNSSTGKLEVIMGQADEHYEGQLWQSKTGPWGTGSSITQAVHCSDALVAAVTLDTTVSDIHSDPLFTDISQQRIATVYGQTADYWVYEDPFEILNGSSKTYEIGERKHGIGAIAVDPNSNGVWWATNSTGINKYEQGVWQPAVNGIGSITARSVAYNPVTSTELYVGTQRHGLLGGNNEMLTNKAAKLVNVDPALIADPIVYSVGTNLNNEAFCVISSNELDINGDKSYVAWHTGDPIDNTWSYAEFSSLVLPGYAGPNERKLTGIYESTNNKKYVFMHENSLVDGQPTVNFGGVYQINTLNPLTVTKIFGIDDVFNSPADASVKFDEYYDGTDLWIYVWIPSTGLYRFKDVGVPSASLINGTALPTVRTFKSGMGVAGSTAYFVSEQLNDNTSYLYKVTGIADVTPVVETVTLPAGFEISNITYNPITDDLFALGTTLTDYPNPVSPYPATVNITRPSIITSADDGVTWKIIYTYDLPQTASYAYDFVHTGQALLIATAGEGVHLVRNV